MEANAIVKVSWSGGKDSTCAVAKHLERGDKVKAVCYVPMFTKEIPLISKAHYSFILNTADYFRKAGAEVYFADKGLTYFEYVTHISLKGKFKGQIFGFPTVGRGQCGFKRDGKLKAISLCDVGYYDYESVGIAYDETKRHNQLNERVRSILCELKITEDQAIKFCQENSLYSPHYSFSERDGCPLCCNAKEEELIAWLNDYPEALPLLIYLQDIVKEQRPDRPPLRGYKYFI
jgi:tRNA(Ile)-lysidine synthase TilS/MesJ